MPESKHKLLLSFYLLCRKALPGGFSEEHSGVVLAGQRGLGRRGSCLATGCPPFPPSCALLARAMEGDCEIWQGCGLCVRMVLFAIPAQIKHVCTPRAAKPLQHPVSSRTPWAPHPHCTGQQTRLGGVWGVRYHCTLSSSSLAEKPGGGSSKQFGLGMKGGLPALEGYKSRLAWLAGQRNGFGIMMCRRKWRTRC